jgi:hypothetical protein
VDEKTAIQALDRKDPVLPLSPGRAERHGFAPTYGTFSALSRFMFQRCESVSWIWMDSSTDS